MMEKVSTETLTGAGVVTSATGITFSYIGDWFVHGGWLQVLSGIAIVATIIFQVRQDRRQTKLFEAQQQNKTNDDSSCS